MWNSFAPRSRLPVEQRSLLNINSWGEAWPPLRLALISFFFLFRPSVLDGFWIEAGRKCPQLSVSLRGRKDSSNDKRVAVFLLKAEFGAELKLFFASSAALHVACAPPLHKCPDMFADWEKDTAAWHLTRLLGKTKSCSATLLTGIS